MNQPTTESPTTVAQPDKGAALSSSDLLGRIVFLCSEGLTTDGAHHKQWALGEILKLVDEPKYHDYKRYSVTWASCPNDKLTYPASVASNREGGTDGNNRG